MIPVPRNPWVLVVEDDVDLLEALCESLRLEAIECEGAPSGARALELLRSGCRPDVVVLDLRMPGIDGREFLLRRRLEVPEAVEIPVVILTGDDVLASEAAKLGSVATVRKPVRIDALLYALKPWVKSSREAS